MFGQVEVHLDGEPYRLATPRKTLQVLTYLLLNRAAPVSREYLAFLLWPDDEEDAARAKLRATISDLLRVLPKPAENFVRVESDALAWNPAAEPWLDVDAFVAASRDRSRLEEAVDLYRGDLLPELYDEWLYAIRERFRNAYLTCLSELVGDARRRGEVGRALEAARAVLAIDPWREDIVRRIMTMRYEAGDRAGALSEYARFVERLRAELNIEPMLETVAVAERITQGRALPDEDTERPGAAQQPELLQPGDAMPLFGRRRELERLSEAWSRAKQGRGGIVFLGGEPGIGKSRLTQEFVRTVEDDGGRVLAGATGVPESFPYQAIVEALRAGLPLVSALELGKTWLAALAVLVPELAQRLDPLPPLAAIDVEQQRLRLFEALARALIALAEPRPLLLVLEDLHWASQATFEALAFVARQTQGTRVLIVATFRDDEAHRRHPLRRLQREAEFQGNATTVSLAPLDLGAVSEIVGRAGDAAAADFAASMLARSGGNPLFLAQLLAAPAHLLSGTVPPTIGSLVGARMLALSEGARTVAEIAALVGERFAVEIVRDVAGWEESAVLAALDELLDRRIVRETSGRGIFRYAFAHQLVQQAIRDAVEGDGLRERSRRIARVLVELYPERASELAADIAGHLESGGEPVAAATQYLHAAARALELGALEDARRNAARGLRIATERETIRGLLLVRAAVSARRADTAEQTADLDTLARMAEETGDEDLRCTVLLRRGRLALQQGSPEAHAILAELQARASRTGSLRWQADAEFNRCLLLEANLHPDEVMRLSRSAGATYAQLGDDAGVANALASLAGGLTYCGRLEEARAVIEEAVEVAERSGDYDARARALRLASGVAIQENDFERVGEVTRRWLDLAVAAGDRHEEAVALTQSAWPLAISPRFAQALPILRRAAAIAREWNLGKVGAMIDINTAEVFAKLGDFAPAEHALERAIAFHLTGSLSNTASAQSALALVHAHDGQPERAAIEARQALQRYETAGRSGRAFVTLENLAEAEWRCGRRTSAVAQLEAALAQRREASASMTTTKTIGLLAALHAELDDLENARLWAAQATDDAAGFVAGGFWPQRSAWATAFAWRRCGEGDLAERWLQRADAMLQEHVAYLNEDERATFVALPWHRNILAARTGTWPDEFW